MCRVSIILIISVLGHFRASALELPALGRIAQLGEFYDGVEEKFLNQRIFSKDLPQEMDLVKTVSIASTETKFQVVKSLFDKLNFMDISGALALSIKTNPSFSLTLTGSGGYVKSEKKSAHHVEGYLLHKIQTEKDTVDLFYEGIRPYIDVFNLMETTASHVVTGIYSGATVIAKFTDTNQMRESFDQIKGKFDLDLTAWGVTIKGGAEFNSTKGDFSNSSSYDIQFSGDVTMAIIPRNAYEVVEKFIKEIPSSLRDINDGKGKPIRYVLTPLAELQEAYKLEHLNSKIVHGIDTAILHDILLAFDEITKTRQRMNDLQDVFNSYMTTCMIPPLKKVLDDLSNTFDARSGLFTSDVRKALVTVRAGNATSSYLHDLLDKYQKDPHSYINVNSNLDHDFDDGERKIQFYEAFKEHQVMYLTESAFEADLIDTDEPIFYVLFYNLTLVDLDTAAWDDATNLFFTQLKQDWTTLKVVDCDFSLGDNSHCRNLNRAVIYSFLKNKKMSSDVVGDYFNFQRLYPMVLPSIENEDPFQPQILYTLGQMYDYQTGSFLDSNLLLPEEVIQPTNVFKTEAAVKKWRCQIVVPSWKDMMLALSIPHTLQVPLLLGNLTLLGSGQVLSVEKRPNMDRMNLICDQRSPKNILDVDDEEIVKMLDLGSFITETEATHFVQGLEYSATSVVSLEKERSDTSRDELLVALQELKLILEEMQEDPVPTADFDLEEYTIKIFSDIFPQTKLTTDSFAGVKTIFGNIQTNFLQDVSKGTTFYTLYPISSIQLEYGIISAPRNIQPMITFSGILQFASQFDRLEEITEKVSKERGYLSQYQDVIPVTFVKEIEAAETSFNAHSAFWTQNLSVAFNAFHDTGNFSALEVSLNSYENLWEEGRNLSSLLEEISSEIKPAIEFYDDWRVHQVDYVSSDKKWRQSFYQAVQKRAYFLLFHLDWLPDYDAIWKENRGLFLDVLLPNSTVYSALLDCSFFPSETETSGACHNATRPVIHEYKNGKLYSDDFLEKYEDGGDVPVELEKLEDAIRIHMKSVSPVIADFEKKVEGMSKDVSTTNSAATSRLDELEEKISSEGNPPPINFVYRQFDGQSTPEILWLSTLWDDITSTIPGQIGTFWKRKI